MRGYRFLVARVTTSLHQLSRGAGRRRGEEVQSGCRGAPRESLKFQVISVPITFISPVLLLIEWGEQNLPHGVLVRIQCIFEVR